MQDKSHYEMLVISPVLGLSNNVIGFIAIEVDMEPIYTFIQDITGMGDTGETLIGKKIGNDVVFLNKLRFDPGAVLKRKVVIGSTEAIPIQNAAQNKPGSGISIDYRGKEIIAAWRYIPLLQWGIVAKQDVSEAFAAEKLLQNVIIFTLLIVLLVVAVLVFLVSYSFTRPIDALQRGVEVISQGNLNHRVGIERNDEIGKLSQGFDKMTKALQETMASRDELNREIIERKNVEDELRKTNQLKSEFVANVAHEFRTPLTIIKETVEVILDNVAGDISAEQRTLLERGDRSINRLNRLVTDVLDISRIEADSMKLSVIKIELKLFIKDILVDYKQHAEHKNINLMTNIPDDLGIIWADKDMLSQLVINLFNNAIKYTPEKGSITFSLSGNDKKIRLEVMDTGIGIPKNKIEKVFEKFERIHSDIKEGAGLGLNIAKKIVDLHHGKIWVESVEKRGSKFVVELPRRHFA